MTIDNKDFYLLLNVTYAVNCNAIKSVIFTTTQIFSPYSEIFNKCVVANKCGLTCRWDYFLKKNKGVPHAY